MNLETLQTWRKTLQESIGYDGDAGGVIADPDDVRRVVAEMLDVEAREMEVDRP